MEHVKIVYYDCVFGELEVAKKTAEQAIEIWKSNNEKKSEYDYDIVVRSLLASFEADDSLYSATKIEKLFLDFTKKYANKNYIVLVNRLQSVANNASRAYKRLKTASCNFKELYILDVSTRYPVPTDYDELIDFFRLDERFRMRRFVRTDEEYIEMMRYIREGHIVKGKFRPRTMKDAEAKYGIRRSSLDKFCVRKYGTTFSNISNSQFGCAAEDVEVYSMKYRNRYGED